MKFIHYKLLLCFLLVHLPYVNAQELKITGTIVDNTDFPIPGVNVSIKDSNIGTITDLDGNFTLVAPGPKSVLITSFVGYVTRQIAIGNKKHFNIVLEENEQALSEVVVVGFGTQKKENLTGAVKSVDVKVLDSRPITSATSGLQGAVGA